MIRNRRRRSEHDRCVRLAHPRKDYPGPGDSDDSEAESGEIEPASGSNEVREMANRRSALMVSDPCQDPIYIYRGLAAQPTSGSIIMAAAAPRCRTAVEFEVSGNDHACKLVAHEAWKTSHLSFTHDSSLRTRVLRRHHSL